MYRLFMNYILYTAIATLALSGIAQAQLTQTGITGIQNGSVDWGDYDNDGDPDVLITGNASLGGLGKVPIANVYNNNGGVFTDIGAGLPGVHFSTARWGDYDNDGDLDILLAGFDEMDFVTDVFINNGGVFTGIMAGLEPLAEASADWGDYDNDGDLDILIMGVEMTGGIATTLVYNNNGGVFTDIMAGITGAFGGAAAWGDYDNDGDLDILLTGNIVGTQVWRNNLNDPMAMEPFTDIMAGLPNLFNSDAAWGDYDNDGYLDILLSGSGNGESSVTGVWRNNLGDPMAMEPFTDIMAGFSILQGSSVAWADYDNDGDLDALITGSFKAELWRNNLNDPMVMEPFTDAMAGLPPITRGAVAWADYDSDNDLDLLLTGWAQFVDPHDNSLPIAQIWRNDLCPNTVSLNPPSGFQASDAQFADRVRLTWNTVPGATGYRVFRSNTPNLASPIPVSGVIMQTTFDDTTADAPSGMGCPPPPPTTFYYYVVAFSSCGVGPRSAADAGMTSSTAQAGLTANNAGDVALLALALAGMWAYQRRRRTAAQ